ncbi:hypothetical protein [Streptomyces candidus]|uniref:Uncharacterized protein n=1 Tax=Streptomyces candidus TaxID=67283 RepID=A0A7X0HGJ3_9ACTN|nr:hypothetical protein [Streptomyces candidus]MBB6436084.1 hypothetical protein [Streptomyces candidus]GHH43563.1 hypothetical protein GCM10018773_29880 [Streptomyces candidus]
MVIMLAPEVSTGRPFAAGGECAGQLDWLEVHFARVLMEVTEQTGGYGLGFLTGMTLLLSPHDFRVRCKLPSLEDRSQPDVGRL